MLYCSENQYDVVFSDGETVHISRFKNPPRPHFGNNPTVLERLGGIFGELVDHVFWTSNTNLKTHGEHVSMVIVMWMRSMTKNPQLFIQVKTVNRFQSDRVDVLYEWAFVKAEVLLAQGVD